MPVVWLVLSRGFITEAAEASPARLKTRVNGLIAISLASEPNKFGLVQATYLENFTKGDAPFVGGIPTILSVFVVAGFSFQGTELIGITAGEQAGTWGNQNFKTKATVEISTANVIAQLNQ